MKRAVSTSELDVLRRCTLWLPIGTCLFRGTALHAKSKGEPLPQDQDVLFLCGSEEEGRKYAKDEPKLVYRYRAQNRPLALFDLRVCAHCRGSCAIVGGAESHQPQLQHGEQAPATEGDQTHECTESEARLAEGICDWFLSRAQAAGASEKDVREYFGKLHAVEAPGIEQDNAIAAILRAARGGRGGWGPWPHAGSADHGQPGTKSTEQGSTIDNSNNNVPSTVSAVGAWDGLVRNVYSEHMGGVVTEYVLLQHVHTPDDDDVHSARARHAVDVVNARASSDGQQPSPSTAPSVPASSDSHTSARQCGTGQDPHAKNQHADVDSCAALVFAGVFRAEPKYEA